MTSVRCLTILFLLTVSALSGTKWKNYDRCNPRWVKKIGDGKLYDCATPGAKNPILSMFSFYTILADILATWNRTIDGKTVDPGNFVDHVERFKGYGPASGHEALKALNVYFESMTLSPQAFKWIREQQEKGLAILLVNKEETGGAVFALSPVDDGQVEVIDSRGKKVSVNIKDFAYALIYSQQPFEFNGRFIG
jgi:hypothetical protein